MSGKTKIEWATDVWNPIRGCSRVSEGCRNCYAEGVAKRFSGPGMPYEGLIAKGGQWNGNIIVAHHIMEQPLRWRRPRRIFVNSMSDLFHENVPDEVIDKVFVIMRMADHHTFQILTKRPERMRAYLSDKTLPARLDELALPMTELNPSGMYVCIQQHYGLDSWPLPNVWLGVSVEDQATADERIPLLLKTPAAVRWISAEPLLGPVDLCAPLGMWWNQAMGCFESVGAAGFNRNPHNLAKTALDWVVVGGESGRNARPMHPAWARSLRDQCEAAGVPFLFKQYGEFTNSISAFDHRRPDFYMHADGRQATEAEALADGGSWSGIYRLGKKSTGRRLDGIIYDQYPR